MEPPPFSGVSISPLLPYIHLQILLSFHRLNEHGKSGGASKHGHHRLGSISGASVSNWSRWLGSRRGDGASGQSRAVASWVAWWVGTDWRVGVGWDDRSLGWLNGDDWNSRGRLGAAGAWHSAEDGAELGVRALDWSSGWVLGDDWH